MNTPVIGMGSVPIAKISFSADIVRPGGDGLLEIKDSGTGFSAWVPRRLGSKIQVGDVLTVLCVPSQDLSMAVETLVCARRQKEGSVTEMIWSRSGYWSGLWTKIG